MRRDILADSYLNLKKRGLLISRHLDTLKFEGYRSKTQRVKHLVFEELYECEWQAILRIKIHFGMKHRNSS